MLKEIENQSYNKCTPRVSVIMGAYNRAATIQVAVDSILSQTFEDWEFIICDDASTDETFEIIKQMANTDSRIRYIRNESNIGCNMVLNRCIEHARGQYIAIMDSDDISLPTRLEKEVEILDNHPEYAIVGTSITLFDENGDYLVIHKKEQPQVIQFASSIPHIHATCMIRRNALDTIGHYITAKKMKRVEDYYMLARLYAHKYRGYNIQEPLIRVCDNIDSYNRRTWQNRLNEAYTFGKTIKLLKLPFYTNIYLIRPLLVGILPRPIYSFLHRRAWKKSDKTR